MRSVMNTDGSNCLQPTLLGTLVRLEPSQPEDLQALYAVAADPLIWAQHPAHDRWQHDVFRAMFQQGLASGGALTVRHAVSGAVIGSSRYYDWAKQGRQLAIGYTFLARSCWGGTFNHEMKRLMLEHAFGFVDRVWFHIGVNNLRSRRAITAIGASFDREVSNDPAWQGLSMAYYYVDRSSRYPAAERLREI